MTEVPDDVVNAAFERVRVEVERHGARCENVSDDERQQSACESHQELVGRRHTVGATERDDYGEDEREEAQHVAELNGRLKQAVRHRSRTTWSLYLADPVEQLNGHARHIFPVDEQDEVRHPPMQFTVGILNAVFRRLCVVVLRNRRVIVVVGTQVDIRLEPDCIFEFVRREVLEGGVLLVPFAQ